MLSILLYMLDVDEKCPDKDQIIAAALIITPFPYVGQNSTVFQCAKAKINSIDVPL
jgi:hypothetical protein